MDGVSSHLWLEVLHKALFHPHLYDIRASQQAEGRPDFEPCQNRARESRECVSVLFSTERPRGEAPRARDCCNSLVAYMRGHLGVRIALCEKLLGRPSWDAALPGLPGRQGWGGGRKGMGMGSGLPMA